jgi:hypothetical protein
MKTSHLTPKTQLPACGLAWSALFGLLLAATASTAFAKGPGNVANTAVIPPQSHPYDLTYADWAARYWQWSLSFPATANPAADTAPPESNQSGPVWFLPTVLGNRTVTRSMTIPSGTALFFPALSVFWDNSNCPENTTLTEAELLELANGQWDAFASLTACIIDGVPVKGLENPQETPYRVETGLYYATVADHDNLLAAVYGVPCFPDGGTIDQVSVGAFLMVKPLPVGQHTIRVIGAAGPLPNPFFTKDATYNITITP